MSVAGAACLCAGHPRCRRCLSRSARCHWRHYRFWRQTGFGQETWPWPPSWADGLGRSLPQARHWHGLLPGCSRIPYVCGAGDDALALHFDLQAGPDSLAEPGVDFVLLSCMHIPVRWQFLQPAQVRPTRSGGGRGSLGSCFHLIHGQRPRPRTQKELVQKIRFGGGTYWFDLSNKVLVLVCTAIDRPGDEQRYLGQQVRRGRKTLLTLKNCGELDSLMRSGFSPR